MPHASRSYRPFDSFSDEAVDRFLAGESTPEELERFQAYLSQYQGDKAWTELFSVVEQRFESDVATGNARARLEARLSVLRGTQTIGKREQGRAWGVFKAQPLRRGVFKGHPLRRAIWPTVATLVLGLLALVWTTRHVSHQATTIMLAYTTGNGQRATITLPDGGTVSLNVASRLEVPMDYMMGNRTVRLVGEGLFTVSHHNGTPMTVMAGGTAARVLGTSFVVRRYLSDTATMVAVRDGKVAVGTSVVTAAHMVAVGRDGVARLHASDASLFTFATGVLTLNWLPLPAAIVELDRWYDADIRLGDPALATRSANGKVGVGSLTDLAEILTLTYDVRVVRDGRVLTLYPRR